MRQQLCKIGAALAGAALLVCAGPALADPIQPGSLVPALDVYVDAVAAGHAAAASCAAAKSPARDAADWEQAKAMFVATLWASGFPVTFARTAGQRLDAAPAGKVNCTDPALAGSLAAAEREGWVKAMQHPLLGMDLKIIDHPVSAEGWNRIKAAFASEISAQKRLFDCVAVTYPELLPAAVHDWDQMLAQIGSKLSGAGLPRDEVAAQLSTAEANSLWHRVAPDAEAGLRDSCAKETAWNERLSMLQYLRLQDEVDKLLPAAAS